MCVWRPRRYTALDEETGYGCRRVGCIRAYSPIFARRAVVDGRHRSGLSVIVTNSSSAAGSTFVPRWPEGAHVLSWPVHLTTTWHRFGDTNSPRCAGRRAPQQAYDIITQATPLGASGRARNYDLGVAPDAVYRTLFTLRCSVVPIRNIGGCIGEPRRVAWSELCSFQARHVAHPVQLHGNRRGDVFSYYSFIGSPTRERRLSSPSLRRSGAGRLHGHPTWSPRRLMPGHDSFRRRVRYSDLRHRQRGGCPKGSRIRSS